MKRIFATFALLAVFACASTQKVAPSSHDERRVTPSLEGREDSRETKENPPPATGEEDGIMLKLTFELPPGWIILPREALPNKEAVGGFVSDNPRALGQVFIQPMSDTDSTTVIQELALILISNGAEPIELVVEDDGSAWFMFALSTDSGDSTLNFLYVKQWSESQGVYTVVTSIWIPGTLEQNERVLSNLKKISDSVTFRRR